MQKYEVEFLDLVTIRSCQMGCEGCCTFSDHKEINGLVDPAQAEESTKFWAERIIPKRLHLFGGEPTMHPKLLDWYRLAKKYWPTSKEGYSMPIWLNTNGYFLDKLFPHIEELFLGDNPLFISVTHHTLMEPYNSLVIENYSKLKELVLTAFQQKYPNDQFRWEMGSSWDSEYKKFSVLKNQDPNSTGFILLNMYEQHDDHFVPHYKGMGKTLEPWYDYNDTSGKELNHGVCHIKNYVQIYNGRLYKCPPRAVLNQTLETYNLQSTELWDKYYNEYESLGTDTSDAEIDAWFAKQKLPENTCNMCGFMFSNQDLKAQEHLPKKMFKIKTV